MKIIAHAARIFVGLVFVFSGVIKLNDPVGTQIKLEEYFEVFAHDFPSMALFWEALVPYALVFSLLLCSLEVLAGVALLLQWHLKRITWFLIALCGFFAFLTFYSAYFNAVTDCGCFGEMIKLKPWTSFWKDMVLLALLLIVLWKRHIFTHSKLGWLMVAALFFCVGLGIYAVRYLPPYDGLAYAVGKNIPASMKSTAPIRFKYLMNKEGKSFEFDQYPSDTAYKLDTMIMLNPEAMPKIVEYRIWNNEQDYSQASFQGNQLFIIVGDVQKANTSTMERINTLVTSLGSQVKVALLSSSSEEKINAFRHEYQLGIPYYFGDFKVLKTIVRTNPGLWLLSNGVVKGKWSYADVPTKEEVLARITDLKK